MKNEQHRQNLREYTKKKNGKSTIENEESSIEKADETITMTTTRRNVLPK